MAEILNNKETYTTNAYEIIRIELRSNAGGKPVDLMEFWSEITIFESIFDDKLVGEIVIRDALNYGELLPIVGNESIHLQYKTKGVITEIVSIKGKVFAPLGKSRTSSEKVEVYKIQFVSDLQFYNRMVRVRSPYQGTITSIASRVFADHFTQENRDKLKFNQDTVGYHKYVFPYWTPLFTLRWLAERAYNDDSSCYVFYEDVDGFHFKDIRTAIENDPLYTYRIEPSNSYNMGDVLGYLTKVIDYSVTSFMDRLEEYHDGMYSGSLFTHNITTKEYEPYTFNYEDDFYNSNHLNEYPLFPQQTDLSNNLNNSVLGFRSVVPIQYRKFDNIKDNELPNKYFLQRRSIQKQFTTQRLTIKVPGNSSLRLLDVLNIQLPKSGYLEDTETDWQDKFISGKYLITVLKTTINKKTGYTTDIEMSKDSLISGLPSKYE